MLVNAAKDITHSFSHLFFPHSLVLVAEMILFPKDNYYASNASSELPLTGFELHQDNPIEKNFWGKLKIDYGMQLALF